MQNGETPGFHGYIEHTSIISQLIIVATETKGLLIVICLDHADAYGTVPHKLIEIALKQNHIHVPGKIATIVKESSQRLYSNMAATRIRNINKMYLVCSHFRNGNESLI